MFKNKEIVEMQQGIKYDPDSSPAALEHYKQVYRNSDYINKHYDLQKQVFIITVKLDILMLTT